jgi:pyruvate dehydrogenase E2 component (dihydrolipoamide acetyltransferase)
MIGVADVEAAAAASAPPTVTPAAAPVPSAVPPTDEERRAAAMRRAIGQVMARSKREIPHYYLGMHIDATAAMSWLAEENFRRPMAQRLLPAVLLLKAAALAVHEVPEVNGFYVDDEFRPSEAVHLGVAVSLRAGGLIAPAIHDADHKSLDELMTGLRDLVQRTRTGRLRSSEMSDPTITITNLGDRGVETVYGVIYAPQVALVGFGKVGERPWAVDGMLGVRQIVHTTLSADHRVSDGHRGGLYLAAIDRLLQEPEKL